MTAIFIVAIQSVACLGLGISVLNALKLFETFSFWRMITWSFAIGFGVLGWLIFPLGVIGLLKEEVLFALLLAASIPVILLREQLSNPIFDSPRGIEWFVLGVIAYVAILSCIEISAPPSDADSLAYHYALTKLFAEEGRIVFVPRAIDGVSPMLVQLTYLPVFALGGERALQIWVLISSWGIIGLVFSEMIHFGIPRSFAALTAAVLITTPVYVYGAHSGQVEARTALFVFVGCFAVASARGRESLAYAILAGLSAGFFADSKYSGLLFCFAVGIVVLIKTRSIRSFVIFCATAAIAGGEWYIWNFQHTGDPVFPILYGVLPRVGEGIWSPDAQSAFLDGLFHSERAVSLTALWWIGYPFFALLSSDPIIEGARTGLGPFVILILPLVIVGLFRARSVLFGHSLFAPVVIIIIFYTLWFFGGASQRIRHLFPIYPVVLVILCVAVHKASLWLSQQRAYTFAVITTMGVHLTILTAYSANFIWYSMSGESRTAFLQRNVSLFDAAIWINRNLGPNERVAVPYRQLAYYLNVPAFIAHPLNQALVDVRPEARDPRKFLEQLRAQNITHVLKEAATDQDYALSTMSRLTNVMIDNGCGRVVDRIDAKIITSRTMSFITSSATGQAFDIVEVIPSGSDGAMCGLL